METVDSPHAPYLIAATTLSLWLVAGCGPTMGPHSASDELRSASETASAAAEAARTAEKEGDRVVIYASSAAGERPTAQQQGSAALPGASGAERAGDRQTETTETETQKGTARADVRLRTYVVERGDDKIEVLHAPHEQDRAVAAFRDAAGTLRSPDTIPEQPGDAESPADGEKPEVDRTPYNTWNRDWSPDRLELGELTLIDDNRVEIRGTAASADDVDEFVNRLESLESFSEIAVDSTGSVMEGQGITFAITGQYNAENGQN